jgi:hypothetical protein
MSAEATAATVTMTETAKTTATAATTATATATAQFLEKRYELPDGRVIALSDERIRCPEAQQTEIC